MDASTGRIPRILWLFSALLIEGQVDCAACASRFEISLREFQRDLRLLREFGAANGYAISKTRGGRIFLAQPPRPRHKGLSFGPSDGNLAAMLAHLAKAIGGPIREELRALTADAQTPSGRPTFLNLSEAVPADDNALAEIYSFLRDAADAAAIVEFAYTPAKQPRASRRVEPYLVLARSGRFYLIAYDLSRRGWRHFALDAIAKPWRRAGTFTPRHLPEQFVTHRAIGWFTGGTPTEVTIRFSNVIAAAAKARVWQEGQVVGDLPGGEIELCLTFANLGEAVRWSLGFGEEAEIVAPPQAVALAREVAEKIAAAYAARHRHVASAV